MFFYPKYVVYHFYFVDFCMPPIALSIAFLVNVMGLEELCVYFFHHPKFSSQVHELLIFMQMTYQSKSFKLHIVYICNV